MNAAKHIIGVNSLNQNIALITPTRSYTFKETYSAVSVIAKYINESNTEKDDKIILLGDSSFYWVIAYLATLLSGRVSVPLPTNISKEKLSNIILQTDPKMIFTQKKYFFKYFKKHQFNAQLIIDEKHNLSSDNSTCLSDIHNASSSNNIDSFFQSEDKTDLASLMFTSGSTGEPRGVMVSHKNIIANTESIIECMHLTHKDRIMAVLPFYYCFGTSLLHTHLLAGGSVVIDNRFMFPEVVIESMLKNRCTGLAGVPSTFQILLRNSTFKIQTFPDLRYVQQAGGKLANIFIEELIEYLPKTEIYIMYGQTEATARLSYLPPDCVNEKPGSIGKGIPGVELLVVDQNSKPVPPGTIGEIIAKGDNITMGYWKDTVETSKSFKNGMLYTGDLAKIDRDGFVYIVDRAKDFLKCGGHRISCKEIEEIVLKFPGIIELVALGQQDENLGEAVRLYVVHPNGEKIKKDLETFCGRNLEWSFVPRKIIFLKKLPKFATGKINKHILKPEIFDGP